MNKNKIRIVSRYYKMIGVAVMNVEDTLTFRDTIHIKGDVSDFTQMLESLEIKHKNIGQEKKEIELG